MPEHLTLGGILKDIGSELRHQAAMGAHEAASLLFRGEAFVMYPKAGQEAEAHQGHGLQQEAAKLMENDGPSM
jgi:hypothetical protein